ncbi:hypothetical protein BD309DRAFT_973730 [Dichomitus squalens]|nr:hypothetical protein BD309DRAFT_973730 [Dichomitus squalens]
MISLVASRRCGHGTEFTWKQPFRQRAPTSRSQITSDGVVDAVGEFRRDPQPEQHDVPLHPASSPVETLVPSPEAAGTGTSGWWRFAPVDDGLIAKILAFQKKCRPGRPA